MFGPVHRNYSFPVLQDKLKEIVFFLKSLSKIFFGGNLFNLIIFLYSSSPSSHLLCPSTNEKHFIWMADFSWQHCCQYRFLYVDIGWSITPIPMYQWTIKMLIRENYLIYIHISTTQCSEVLNPISLVAAPLVCEGGPHFLNFFFILSQKNINKLV